MLPAFVVLGAMKAGTVSLRHHLDDHPHVRLGRGGTWGEPNFFIAEHNWSRGRAWYESLFADVPEGATPGECSPSYSMAETYAGVPERMAALIPHARLVYVVRHPVDRMRSMYMHQVAAGRERRSAEVALRDPHYLGPSRYGFQIDAYLAHFDREQLLVVPAERLRADPASFLALVLRHLGVAPVHGEVRHYDDHASSSKRVSRLHGRLLWARASFKEDVRPQWRPDMRSGVARALTTRPVSGDDGRIPAALASELWDRFAPDRERLRDVVGDAEYRSWGWLDPRELPS